MAYTNHDDNIINELLDETMPIESPNVRMQHSISELPGSYFLVNKLLNILVRKGIIQPSEIQGILAELHQAFSSKRGDSDEN